LSASLKELPRAWKPKPVFPSLFEFTTEEFELKIKLSPSYFKKID
jgi:hypothetical protein